MLVCWCEFGHWMCGESWYHQRSLTHHFQFSKLGIQCPTLVYVMLIGSGLMGGFLSILSEFSCLASAMHYFSITK